METSYYNTTRSTHPELGRREKKAKSQEDSILRWFKQWRFYESPSDIWKKLFNQKIPLTSVRRAMTNLTNQGELVKTNKQMRGIYGNVEHQWRLADKYDQKEMFI